MFDPRHVTGHYILDAHGQPVPCEDLMAWAQWMHGADRHVAQDRDEAGGTDVRVSTVFLGLDHGFGFDEGAAPVLWETLVFGGPLDGEMDRYTSRDEALLGHQAMCRRVAAATPKPQT